jgi:hypothetical protein
METLQRTANRGSISTGGYEIDNSVKLQTSGVNSEFFNYTISSAGSRTTGTVSMWIKRTTLGVLQYLWEQGDTDNDNGRLFARFGTDDTLRVAGGSTVFLNTNRVFRDTSAWYHIVVAIDTTSGTADNRARIYVNGVEETSFSTRNNFSQNDITGTNFEKQFIGLSIADESSFQSFSGYMAEVVFQDGVASAPTEFGEFDSVSGIWVPKDASGATMGTNGAYLKFENAASMGAATAGHGFSVQNINQGDQATDTPTNNFCTWMPLWTFANMATIGNGGTSSIGGGGSVWRGAKGSIGVSRGKWYWENKASGTDTIHGWQTENCVPPSGTNSHNVISTIAFYEQGNYIWLKDSTSGRNDSSVTGTYAGGQVVGFALNLDSSPQTATFYRNGSAIATNVNIDGLADQTIFPMTSHYNQTSDANFGGYTNISNSHTNTDENGYGAFVYAPPSGYYALCTKNLAEYG